MPALVAHIQYVLTIITQSANKISRLFCKFPIIEYL